MARAPQAPPPPAVQWFQAPDGSWHPVAAVPPPPPATQVTVKHGHPIMGLLACMLLGFVAVVVIGAFGSTSTTTASKTTGTTIPAEVRNAANTTACGQFRALVDDIGAGRLHDGELQTRVRVIQESAVNGASDVRNAATHMAGSAGTPEFGTAEHEMDMACKAAGH